MKVSQHAREKFAESKKIGKCVCFLCKCTGVKVHAQRTTQRLSAHLSSLCTAEQESSQLPSQDPSEENGVAAAQPKGNVTTWRTHATGEYQRKIGSCQKPGRKVREGRRLFGRCECVEGTEKRLAQAYGRLQYQSAICPVHPT